MIVPCLVCGLKVGDGIYSYYIMSKYTYVYAICIYAYTYVVYLLVGEPLYAIHLPLHALPCHMALQAFHRMPQPRLREIFIGKSGGQAL